MSMILLMTTITKLSKYKYGFKGYDNMDREQIKATLNHVLVVKPNSSSTNMNCWKKGPPLLLLPQQRSLK